VISDSRGEPYEVVVALRKDDGGVWEWHVLNGAWTNPTEVGGGTLSFDTRGQLVTETTSPIVFDFPGARPGQLVAFDFGGLGTEQGAIAGPTTQFAAPSETTSLSQDGVSRGRGSGISVAEGGLPMLRPNSDPDSGHLCARATWPDTAWLLR
jgi:hypothetical protein